MEQGYRRVVIAGGRGKVQFLNGRDALLKRRVCVVRISLPFFELLLQAVSDLISDLRRGEKSDKAVTNRGKVTVRKQRSYLGVPIGGPRQTATMNLAQAGDQRF